MNQPILDIRKGIFTYLLITFSLSWIVDVLIINSKDFNRIYIYAVMWCPALGAYLTCKRFNIRIAGFAWGWGASKYLTWSYLTPLIYISVAYLMIWFTGLGGFYNKEFVIKTAKSLGWGGLPDQAIILLSFVVQGTIGMFGSMSTALGEEIGWRGFLVPQLHKITSYTKISLITGVIWALYHYPVLIFSDYNNGAPVWYGLTCFTVMIISSCFIMTWFRLKSKSLWTGVLFHASHNLFIQQFFTPITKSNNYSKYFIDEFGAVLAITSLATAIYFWSRRKELESTSGISNSPKHLSPAAENAIAF
jgi:membrane protease YdiL (CAAX protease family)